MNILRKILNTIGILYATICTTIITYYIVVLAIFGGDFHIYINFESWNELMDKL